MSTLKDQFCCAGAASLLQANEGQSSSYDKRFKTDRLVRSKTTLPRENVPSGVTVSCTPRSFKQTLDLSTGCTYGKVSGTSSAILRGLTVYGQPREIIELRFFTLGVNWLDVVAAKLAAQFDWCS